MKCDVIRDLIPLYIDGCCSKESRREVEKHLEECEECRGVYALMSSEAPEERTEIIFAEKIKNGRIGIWKASIFQSLLLLFSFSLITLGVYKEAATPIGKENGFWAFALVIPAVGFMLSLAGWYFVRLYESRTSFVCASSALAFIITSIAYMWGWNHYSDVETYAFNNVLMQIMTVAATLVSCALSYVYARIVGKE